MTEFWFAARLIFAYIGIAAVVSTIAGLIWLFWGEDKRKIKR